jgi:hypothetical protein
MADAANPNWMAVVFSSAVVSGCINLVWNWWTRRAGRKREGAKEANRIKHVYLDIALHLELFCYQCMNEISEISDAQHLFVTGQDRDALGKLRSISLRFEVEPSWVDLPVEFVATIKELIAGFDAAGEWVADAFQAWADGMDGSSFEQQRLAFYGSQASQLAKETRQRIDAGRNDMDGYQVAFDHFLGTCRAQYSSNPEGTILPELRQLFSGSLNASHAR